MLKLSDFGLWRPEWKEWCVREIYVRGGKKALVSQTDLPSLRYYPWHLKKDLNTFYAATQVGYRKRREVRMHSLIIPEVPTGFVRHHKDRNGLNNTRSNLQVILFGRNVAINGKTDSGINKTRTGKFQVDIKVDRRRYFLGTFNSIEAAREARDTTRAKLLGESDAAE